MDIIDREQAITLLILNRPRVNEEAKYAHYQFDKDIKTIITMPSAEKTGRWIAYEFGDERWRKCSVCGTADEYINHLGLVAIRNYCPYCGARMVD